MAFTRDVGDGRPRIAAHAAAAHLVARDVQRAIGAVAHLVDALDPVIQLLRPGQPRYVAGLGRKDLAGAGGGEHLRGGDRALADVPLVVATRAIAHGRRATSTDRHATVVAIAGEHTDQRRNG